MYKKCIRPDAEEEKMKKLGEQPIKRVAAGTHFPTHWRFEPAKRPDDIADYCLNCSFQS